MEDSAVSLFVEERARYIEVTVAGHGENDRSYPAVLNHSVKDTEHDVYGTSETGSPLFGIAGSG
jgi:hypothetical protein